MGLSNRLLSIWYSKKWLKSLPQIKFDKRRFQQVLLNLLTNATKYQSQGQIKIKVSLLDDSAMGNEHWIQVGVQDQGVGMTPEQIQNIFTPFGQVNHRGDICGNGVGLSICKMICEHLDGTLSVDSQVGEGSLFIFTMKFNYVVVQSSQLNVISERTIESSNTL